MAAYGKRVVSFDSFARGDYGLEGEWNAPPGSYSGTNVQTYIDGSVGPRSGLIDMEVTTDLVAFIENKVIGFGHNPSQDKIWFVVDRTVRQFSSEIVGQAAVTLANTLAFSPTERIKSAEQAASTYITSYDDAVYELNHETVTVTRLGASPGGRVIAVYGEFLVVGGLPFGLGDRIQFSSPGDFTTWPAINYISVGVGYEILLLTPQRQYLTIAKHDGSWWVLSGTLGISDFLRRIIRAYTLGDGFGVTRWTTSGDGNVWLVPREDQKPVVFTGSTVRAIESQTVIDPSNPIDDTGLVPSLGITGLESPTDMFFITADAGAFAPGKALLFHRNLWSHHEFNSNMSGWVDGRLRKRMYMCEGQATGEVKFYAWEYQLDRPPRAGMSFESMTDAGFSTPFAAEFSMPEWWSKDEEEVRVRAVIVDFKKFGHGFAFDNQFTIEVLPLRRYAGEPGTVVTSEWSEPESDAEEAGTLDRYKKNFATQFANGFVVSITGMAGVAIQKIHVVLDTRPTQGVA